jgi:DNA-directed RNA polymerase subunit beta'
VAGSPPDLNDLYRRVINRSNRLKRLITWVRRRSSSATRSGCCRNPWTLFDNGRRGPQSQGGQPPAEVLSDLLKGKQGRFRQNLLGKRVGSPDDR